MFGGDTKLVENIRPLLEIMGNKIYHLGPFGTGMSAKVSNNFVVACSVLSVRHVMDEADKIEIPKEKILAVLNSSSEKIGFPKIWTVLIMQEKVTMLKIRLEFLKKMYVVLSIR